MKVPRVLRDLGRHTTHTESVESVEDVLLSCRQVIVAAVEKGEYPGNLRPNLRRLCTVAQGEHVPLRELLVRLRMMLDETPALYSLTTDDRLGFKSAVTQYVLVNFEAARRRR